MIFLTSRAYARIAFAACLALATPVFAQEQPASPPPNPTQTSLPALLIRMRNSQYIPSTSTIKIGQSVQFENDDEVGHTVTAADSSFDSGYLGKGEVWRTTFSHTGTALFSDIYHPAMRGSIIILVN